MGITISYRGRLRDLALLDTLEDRIVELAVECGGFVRLWRTHATESPGREVRGALLDLAPGVDTVSLLLSPDGSLIPLHAIEASERGTLDDRPWVFVKTEFGSIAGHVMLVELLTALRKEFFPDLEVEDEGEYWHSRDLERLRAKRALSRRLIDTFTKTARKRGLSREAAEDPEILIERLRRIAEEVHRAIIRPPEHPPVSFGEDDDEGEVAVDPRKMGTEADWDRSDQENRRKIERLMRAIEEGRRRGEDHAEAFRNAMRDEGITDLPGEERAPADFDLEEETADTSEEWKKGEESEDGKAADRDRLEERHPLMRRVTRLYLRVMRIADKKRRQEGSPISSVVQGVGEMSGGMAQALPDPGEEEAQELPFGLCIVQLKRALRGAAFARGALDPARVARQLTRKEVASLFKEIEAIEHAVQVELHRLRRELRGE